MKEHERNKEDGDEKEIEKNKRRNKEEEYK